MKFKLLIVLLSLFSFTISGCQEDKSVKGSEPEVVKAPEPEATKTVAPDKKITPGKLSVIIDGDGEFPAELAGNWKGRNGVGWGFVIEEDGSISSARIDTARQLVIPGEVNISETKYGGRKGITDGTLVFDGLEVKGDYQARLYFKDSYDVEAVYNFSVGKANERENVPAASVAPSLKTSKTSYEVGEKIEVEFTNALGAALDWVSLYEEGAIDNMNLSLGWFYTDGRKVGEARYVPGDWSITYSPQNRELAVEVEMRDIYVEMSGAVVHGSSVNYFVGPISEDGSSWDTIQFSYPRFDKFPIASENLPIEKAVVFEKVDEDI